MSKADDLQNLLNEKQLLLNKDEARLEIQRENGKMTAAERINTVLDQGSFVEMYAMLSDNGKAAGVTTGYGTVDDRPIYIFAQDFTVMGGSIGKVQAEKVCKLLKLAQKTGAPVLAILDSAGVRLDEGIDAMNAYCDIYAAMSNLSGVCPMISVVAGPCMGGAAIMSQLCDFTVMAKDVGQIMMYGATVVSAAYSIDIDGKQLGGADNVSAQGGCAVVAENEAQAFATAKMILSMLPDCNADAAPLNDGEDMNKLLAETDADNIDALFSGLFDTASFVELYSAYANTVRIALGKMAGRTVAVVSANGLLDAKGMKKASRFVRFADSFNIPVVSLINTDGVEITKAADQVELIKAQSQLLYSYNEATSAKVSVITGNAIGQAYIAMGGKPNADISYAWPNAILSALKPEAAIQVVCREEIKNSTLPVNKAKAEIAKKYIEEKAGALAAAKAGVLDDVIDPKYTRMYVISALEMLASKREETFPRKHGNLPL